HRPAEGRDCLALGDVGGDAVAGRAVVFAGGTIPRRALLWLLVAAILFPVLMVLAAPFIAVWIHREGVPNYATHYRLLAQAIDKIWHANVNAPLHYLGSYTNIVNGVSFYLPDKPSTIDIVGPDSTPWADAASVARAGVALV